MRLEQEPTARPAAAPKGRWSEYTQLSRQLKQAGLLDRRRGWYAARIGLNLALLAGGWVGFAILGDSCRGQPVQLLRPGNPPPPHRRAPLRPTAAADQA